MERQSTRRGALSAVGIAVCLAGLPTGPATAEGRGEALQGIFCNTEAQLDAVLAAMSAGASPGGAVEIANVGAVACTLVDRLGFVVVDPVVVADGGAAPFAKHRGTLTGVLAGGALRPVTPPVTVFFATPDRLAEAREERRT